MTTPTFGIQPGNDIRRNADAGRTNTGVSVSVSNGGAPATRLTDPAAARFVDRAMTFAQDSRGRDANALFGSFKPQANNGSTDIRVSIGLTAPTPRIDAPPMPRYAPPVSNPTNAKTTMEGGKAVFENDNYTIAATESNQSVRVTNKKTGGTYEAWGDPHMAINGQHAFDFKGTTSLALDDGTKVTLGTTDVGNGTTQSSKVTITNGDYGVEIKGVDNKKDGDLAYQEYRGQGQALDDAVDDGVTLEENAAGNSLVTTDRNGHEFQVDQNYIDKNDELATRGKSSDNVEQFTRLGYNRNGLDFASARDSDWAYQAVRASFGGYGGNTFSFSNNGGDADGWGGQEGSSSLGASSDWLKSLKAALDSVDEEDEAPPPPPRRATPRRDAVHVGVNVQGNADANVRVAVNALSRLAPGLRLWG